jgi:hypothetical protein
MKAQIRMPKEKEEFDGQVLPYPRTIQSDVREHYLRHPALFLDLHQPFHFRPSDAHDWKGTRYNP